MTIRGKLGRTLAAIPQKNSGNETRKEETKMATKAKANGKPKAEKKPKPKKQKLDKGKLIDEKIDELLKMRRDHSLATSEWEVAHAEAGERKKTMERKQALVNGIILDIDNIRSGNYTPPLPFGVTAPTDHAAKAPSALRADGPWESVEMSTLINGSILDALHEADLKTLGDVHNFTATNKRLSEIKRIGPGKAAKIEDAILQFWTCNPQKVTTEADESKG